MTSPGRIFMDCLSLSSSASKLDNDEDDNVIDNEDHSSQIFGCCSVGNGGMRRERPSLSSCSNRIANGFSFGGDQRQARCGSRRICSCHTLWKCHYCYREAAPLSPFSWWGSQGWFVSDVTNKIKNVLEKVFFTLATCMPETTILCATNLIYSRASSGDELRSWLSISNSIPNIL